MLLLNPEWNLDIIKGDWNWLTKQVNGKKRLRRIYGFWWQYLVDILMWWIEIGKNLKSFQ